MTDTGTLRPSEFHPAARDAMAWLRAQPALPLWLESFASCAIEGNRTAELCSETLRRVLASEPVSDRYLLGLCWTMAMADESDDGPRHRQFILAARVRHLPPNPQVQPCGEAASAATQS